LLNRRGARMDRHAATRRLHHLAEDARIQVARAHPHMLRHTFVICTEGRGVASDATFRARHEDDAVRGCCPGTAGRRSRRQSEPAGQDSRDRTVLRQVPGCCVHSGCMRCKHDTAKATKKRSDEGRCHYRPVVTLTHSAGLVNRSLPVPWRHEARPNLTPASSSLMSIRYSARHVRKDLDQASSSLPSFWPYVPHVPKQTFTRHFAKFSTDNICDDHARCRRRPPGRPDRRPLRRPAHHYAGRPPERARQNLDRHPNYILAAYMASGT
jgi:hypothetical protein